MELLDKFSLDFPCCRLLLAFVGEIPWLASELLAFVKGLLGKGSELPSGPDLLNLLVDALGRK